MQPRTFPRRFRFASALILMLGAAPAMAAAQGEPSSLVVTVRIDGGPMLRGAQVAIEGLGRGGITDGNGVARLANLPPGAKTISVRHLGYAPSTARVTLEGGRTSSLSFVLVPKPIELAEVKVRVWRTALLRNGFFDRRSRGSGVFYTRQEIDQLRPRYMSDLIRRLAGVRVQSGALPGTARASMRGQQPGRCPIQYYVDGALTGITNLDEIRPEDVEGLEIYRGASSIPPSFNKGTAACGVVLVWTRVAE